MRGSAVHDGRAEREGKGLLAPIVTPLSRRLALERQMPVFRRDPDLIRRTIRPVRRLTGYFSPEVRGLEHLPASGPVLVVGNHSCLFYMPDVWIVGLSILARRGVDQPAYSLTYDLLMGVPGVGSFLRRIGAIPAGGDEARQALSQGAAVLVYPGGDLEACRPWTARDKVDLAGHKGFVKLALETGVPVVPVVTHGAHSAVFVLSRGELLAKVFGLNRIRIKVFPIVLGPPFGINSILTPPPPLPASVTIEFLPPLEWASLGPHASEDDATVDACYDEITQVMQRALDRIRSERPHPVLRGISHVLRGDLSGVEVPAR